MQDQNIVQIQKPLEGDFIAAGEDPIQAGAVVWHQIEDSENSRREEWHIVGAGLKAIQNQCVSSTGNVDNKKFGKLCTENGYTMDAPIRSNAVWLHDNYDSVLQRLQVTSNHPTRIRSEYLKVDKQEKLENKKEENKLLSTQAIHDNPPVIHQKSYEQFLAAIPDQSIDVLITDPPYSTDIEDIEGFAAEWLPLALAKIKTRAYICIGAYPKEMQAYFDVLLNHDDFILDNPLIWTYRNTLGVTPKEKYNLNYQVILHLYKEGAELDTSITNEMFSVQDINAPDGRQGDRFHTWQKPDELANRLVRHSTKSGDTVIDPFSCTGTFLIAAARHGCHAAGCDIDPEAIDIAVSRGCHHG